MANKMAAEAIFHAPCAFGLNGATAEVCRQMTASVARNLNGCKFRNCQSPLRICWACVTQGARELVTNFKTGLCDFHDAYGADAVPSKERREKPLPGDEDTSSRLPAVARRVEAVSGNDSLVRVELCAPAPALGPTGKKLSLEKKDKKTVALPLPPGRVHKKRGLVEVRRRGSKQSEQLGALEVIGILRTMHEAGKTWEEARKELGLRPNHALLLRSLGKLPETIQRRLSSTLPAEERLSLTFAVALLQIPRAEQEAEIEKYLTGKRP